jgi:cysteinyl-tRNA synthetase
MALKIYNTLKRKVEKFKPIKEGEVLMYTCGPTVYDFAHIGNFRAYICADVLKRYLKYSNYKVKHVMNITDVDDKTIRESRNQGVKLKDYTEKYTKAFFEDLKALNIEQADVFPRATETIPEMVDMIKCLMDKGYAYKGEDGSIYYKISEFKDYGKLANLNTKELQTGASGRVKTDEYEKDSAHDFALWKAWDENDGDVFWDIEIGKGRPGWHIECSAMSMKYLAEKIDIHTGGVDLIFPHHQNEIAQSEAYSGKSPFVRYWVHNEYLQVEGKKMSKSLGNFYTLRDIMSKGYNPVIVRYVLLSTHYRTQFNFTFEGLSAADAAVKKLNDFIQTVQNLDTTGGEFDEKIVSAAEKAKKKFEKAMDDDLNTSNALGAVFDFMHDINRITAKKKVHEDNIEDVIEMMKLFDAVLGVMSFEKHEIDEEIKKLIEERELARKNKDFKTSDRIRDELLKKGIIIQDTPEGPRWMKK